MFVTALTGSQINQNVRSPDTCQSSASNNIVANLCVSPQGISAPNKPLSQCIHGAGGHQNTDPRVPRVFPLRDVSEEQLTTGAEMQACQGSRATVDTHQHENGLPSYSMTYHPRGNYRNFCIHMGCSVVQLFIYSNNCSKTW